MARSKASAPVSSRSPIFAPAFSGTFYPADVDGAPAAFVVDLEQEPRPSHPTRITVSVPMLEAEPDGLRSEREMEDLDALQTKITERLARAAGADCVGFYDLRGVATFVYYAQKKTSAEEAALAIDDVSPYQTDVLVDEDPEWRFYIDALFPDAYALQGIWNRLIIDELESHGDDLHEPRDVDHVATFASKVTAKQAAKKLEAAHFEIDVLEDADEAGRFALGFHRKETLEEGKPDRFAAEILDIVLPLDGEYDGWGAPAAEPPASKAKTKPAKKAKAAKAKPAKAKAAKAKVKPAKTKAAKSKAKPAKAKPAAAKKRSAKKK
jgi:hypothetical protein